MMHGALSFWGSFIGFVFIPCGAEIRLIIDKNLDTCTYVYTVIHFCQHILNGLIETSM